MIQLTLYSIVIPIVFMHDVDTFIDGYLFFIVKVSINWPFSQLQ